MLTKKTEVHVFEAPQREGVLTERLQCHIEFEPGSKPLLVNLSCVLPSAIVNLPVDWTSANAREYAKLLNQVADTMDKTT